MKIYLRPTKTVFKTNQWTYLTYVRSILDVDSAVHSSLPRPLLSLHTYTNIPNMNTFIERSTGKKFAIWTESYTVDRFLVFCERVYTCTSFNLPQSDSRIERCTETINKTDATTQFVHYKINSSFASFKK